MKLIILLLLAPTLAFTQTEEAKLINRFISGQHDYYEFNGNVLVAEKGIITYAQALGYADYDSKRELDYNSVFELASLSKQFTAMGIMICKEKGLLSYDDDIKKFFPSLPYDHITVRHLLTHTSGLPSYEDQFKKKWDHKKIAFNKDVIEMLCTADDALFFSPGKSWKYSNTGYALLASIIEKVTGRSYQDFMADQVFTPLGMMHTFVYNTRRSGKKLPDDYALGYVYFDSLKSYVLPDLLPAFDYVYYLDGIVGDGCVNSTIGDLLKWDRALYGNKLVSQAALEEMLSPLVPVSAGDSLNFYGFGLQVQPRTERGKRVSHSGGWPGYSTWITRFTDKDQTIIILSNNQSNTEQISASIESILAGQPLEMPYKHKAETINASLLNRYVGKYSAFLTLELIRKGDKLFRHREGTPDIGLVPESETKFFYADGTDRQIEFEVDNTGKVTKAWFINTGQKVALKKL